MLKDFMLRMVERCDFGLSGIVGPEYDVSWKTNEWYSRQQCWATYLSMSPQLFTHSLVSRRERRLKRLMNGRTSVNVMYR